MIPDESHVEDHVPDREVLEEPGNEAGNMEYPVSEDSGWLHFGLSIIYYYG